VDGDGGVAAAAAAAAVELYEVESGRVISIDDIMGKVVFGVLGDVPALGAAPVVARLNDTTRSGLVRVVLPVVVSSVAVVVSSVAEAPAVVSRAWPRALSRGLSRAFICEAWWLAKESSVFLNCRTRKMMEI
jgi:hypothetical protein